ncbi:hypothetical protein [Parasegetibacter sp. NRK P23]|uniref:hypothetical protein n=1 Tax=Parasegetibacter sp. NRK P23 TaxID=2942999 RepID=UPI002043CD4B|nr:hypothetical protein [Parasegetibacter sp. NRK P23]MCM5528962.1 hypothetical protein [Parasegetibacter sp. NRK P23]
MNIFDSMHRTAQKAITKTMGYMAQWMPLTGGDEITGSVLYNEPTRKQEISEQDFETFQPWMEYLEGEFPGLLESVRNNNPETVVINGRTFVTLKNGSKKYDGKTIIINLEEQI